MAPDSVVPSCSARASARFRSSGRMRRPTIGVTPVDGRPRFRFFCLTVVDFTMTMFNIKYVSQQVRQVKGNDT
jgi:hypothetical protein